MTPSPVSPRHSRPGSPWTELKGQPIAQGHEVALTVRRTYDVVVDGKRAGSVEMNETVDIPVEPGCLTVQVRKGRNSSRTKTFDVAKGGIRQLPLRREENLADLSLVPRHSQPAALAQTKLTIGRLVNTLTCLPYDDT